MKSFQLFNEDAQEAKERQLRSLEDLERRREQAQTKAREIAGTFKQRTRKRLKRIKSKHDEIKSTYQHKIETVK